MHTSNSVASIVLTQRLSTYSFCITIMQLRQGLRATRSLSFSTSIATGVRRKPALPSTRRGQTSSTSNLFQRDIRPNHIATRCFTSSRSIDRDIATASFQTANADMTSQPKISELSDKAFSELSALTTCEVGRPHFGRVNFVV